jgi:hypothetical protein
MLALLPSVFAFALGLAIVRGALPGNEDNVPGQG